MPLAPIRNRPFEAPHAMHPLTQTQDPVGASRPLAERLSR